MAKKSTGQAQLEQEKPRPILLRPVDSQQELEPYERLLTKEEIQELVDQACVLSIQIEPLVTRLDQIKATLKANAAAEKLQPNAAGEMVYMGSEERNALLSHKTSSDVDIKKFHAFLKKKDRVKEIWNFVSAKITPIKNVFGKSVIDECGTTEIKEYNSITFRDRLPRSKASKKK